jgi:methionyl-tRNA formyltransferase
VRAFNPVPGAWTLLPNGERLKILEAACESGQGEPGQISDDRMSIFTGQGALRPLIVQRQGKRPMPVGEFLRGLPLKAGDRLA